MAGPLNLGQCSLHFPLERSARDWGIRPQEEGQCGQLEQKTQGSLPWAVQGGAEGFLAVPQGPAPRELKMPGCPHPTLLPGLRRHPVLGAGCHLKGQGREQVWAPHPLPGMALTPPLSASPSLGLAEPWAGSKVSCGFPLLAPPGLGYGIADPPSPGSRSWESGWESQGGPLGLKNQTLAGQEAWSSDQTPGLGRPAASAPPVPEESRAGA